MRIEGVVVDFDDDRGDGWIDDGDGRWYFHCVAIADGSRHVDNGLEVSGIRVAGHRGADEVGEVRPRRYEAGEPLAART